MPSCRVEYTTIDVVCAARKFSVQTYRVLKKGWLSIFGREHLITRGGMPCSALPDFSPGEPVPVSGCNIVRKRTLPVSPYTDEELVGYMDRRGLGPSPRVPISSAHCWSVNISAIQANMSSPPKRAFLL